jgi:hypothetical protein
MAIQPELGLLSKRRTRHRTDYRADPGAAGLALTPGLHFAFRACLFSTATNVRAPRGGCTFPSKIWLFPIS